MEQELLKWNRNDIVHTHKNRFLLTRTNSKPNNRIEKETSPFKTFILSFKLKVEIDTSFYSGMESDKTLQPLS